jgi:hypothetical protein
MGLPLLLQALFQTIPGARRRVKSAARTMDETSWPATVPEPAAQTNVFAGRPYRLGTDMS